MKKVLIISYYWPPSGGSGVQRWLKFSKYLPQNGWQPIIYTPENPDFDVVDQSLLKDVSPDITVLQTPIFEPYSIAKLFSRKKQNSGVGDKASNENNSLLQKLALWTRGNIMVPDPRIFWVRSSVRFLTKYLQENPVDAIISTGPPHSMHLIARNLKRKVNIPWIADFRDPFSKTDAYNLYYLSTSTRKKIAAMERSITSECDIVLSTSYNLPEMMEPFDTSKLVTITNGFDAEDLKNIPAHSEKDEASPYFTLTHAGTMGEVRNPEGLWNAINELHITNPELVRKLRVVLIGNVAQSILNFIASHSVLSQVVSHIAYMPHSELMKHYAQADALLLLVHSTPIGKVCIPGKVFEYLALKKNILAFGPKNCDTSILLNNVKAGWCFDYQESQDVQTVLTSLLTEGQKNMLSNQDILAYSRETLTLQLVNELNKLTNA